MDYIQRNDLLNFDKKKTVNIQYYQWNQKRRREQQKQQCEHFHKQWHQLEEQDQKRCTIHAKDKKNNKLLESKVATVKPQITYMKNMIWKQQVQDKIDRIRQEKIEELQRQETKIQEESLFKEKKMFRDPQHKGPVKAWEERFQNYIKVKCGQKAIAQQNFFHPNIDKNSRRIANTMGGKVEDRLIQYGQKLKQKKAEMEAMYEQQLYDKRIKQSADSDASDIFWRLYKDGQLMNKKKNERVSEYTFTPEINQNSVLLASKVTEKRKPLYQSKIVQQIIEVKKPKNTKNTAEKMRGFNDFLKRNEAHQRKIERHQLQKLECIKEKQNRQSKICTFAPQLNPNSRKIVTGKPIQFRQLKKRTNVSKNHSSNEPQFIIPKRKQSLVKSSAVESIKSLNRHQKSLSLIERLNSQGNFILTNRDQFIGENQSLSNILVVQNSKQLNDYQFFNIKREPDQQNDGEQLFTNEKSNQYTDIINQELQQDSIERQKDVQWQNQLERIEQQIEEMMKRAEP